MCAAPVGTLRAFMVPSTPEIGREAISSGIHWLFQASASTLPREPDGDALDARQAAAVFEHQLGHVDAARRQQVAHGGAAARRVAGLAARPRPW